jgi:hypothetical protein
MPRRLARIAALAVGEGKSEMALLNHIRPLYLPRGCGTTLKVQGNIGKGGRGVLTYAIRISAGIDYDRRIVLLDTDTDWDDRERARASNEGIIVIESDPCLEAWLLAIHGFNPQLSSLGFKREFLERFGAPAHDPGVYTTNFRRDRLDGARATVPTLERLLSALGA